METFCMKSQILFSGKYKKNINLSSAAWYTGYQFKVIPILKTTCIKLSPVLNYHYSDPILKPLKVMKWKFPCIKQAPVFNNLLLAFPEVLA